MERNMRMDWHLMGKPLSVPMMSLQPERPSRCISCRTAGLVEVPMATVFRTPSICQTGSLSSWPVHNQHTTHQPPQQCSPVQQQQHRREQGALRRLRLRSCLTYWII